MPWIDLSDLIKDLRECARHVKSHPDETIAAVHRTFSALQPRPFVIYESEIGRLGHRLKQNLAAGIRVARSNPDMLRAYLLNAAGELESYADQQRKEGSDG